MPRHILVLGSTSPLGTSFCLSALRDSHTLTLYIRPSSASKLPPEISSHPSVTIITGPLAPCPALSRALSCGAKTLISFLGPVLGVSRRGAMPISEGYAAVLEGVEREGYERVMVTSTASYKVREDRFSVMFWLMVCAVWLLFRGAYDEINGFTPLVTGLDGERVRWTVFRVPALRSGSGSGSGKVRGVNVGHVGDRGVGVVLDREALAEWVLREMEEEKWVGKCPAVSNA